MINRNNSLLKDKPSLFMDKGIAFKLTNKKEGEKRITDLANLAAKGYAFKTARLAKIARLSLREKVIYGQSALSSFNEENSKKQNPLRLERSKGKGVNTFSSSANSLTFNTKKLLPKIVGDIKHYPPANKEWKNSIYAYNKNSLRSIAAMDRLASKTIKSHFNLTNNRKLARSYRMRNLIRRTTSKRIFTSKPEIKQTSNKVNITVYILNREGQFLLRKLYFYKKNMNINRDVYLHKIWLKKNLLAFKKTFKDKKSIRLLAKNKKLMTKRKKINKTYIHNILIKRYLSNDSLSKTLNNSLSEKEQKTSTYDSSLSSNLITTQDIKTLQSRSLMKRNIFKSLKKRNLISRLKRREKLTLLPASFKNSDLFMNGKAEGGNTLNLPFISFYNYLVEKKSRKIKFKLRNTNSIIKIKKKLSLYFFSKGRRRKIRSKKIRLPYSNFKFKNEIRFFSFKLVSELKYIRKLFLFRFIRYIFSLLKIKIYLSKNLETFASDGSKDQPTIKTLSLFSDSLKQEQTLKQTLGQAKNNHLSNSLNYVFIGKGASNTASSSKSLISQTVKSSANDQKIIHEFTPLKVSSFKNRYSYSKLKKIELLNLELLNFLKYIISKPQLSKKLDIFKDEGEKSSIGFNKNKFDSLYKKFEKKYFLKFLAKYFKKEFLYINYFSKFLINKFKFGKFLPGLKYLINKIYSKKVKLNIVNLKYPHLNSDIYADSITSKLKKKLGLLRVLRSSLALAKLPSEYISLNRLAGFNELSSLTIHQTLNVNDLSNKKNYGVENKLTEQGELLAPSKDPLNLVLNKLYPYSFVTSVGTLTKENNLDRIQKRPNNLQKESVINNNSALSKNLKILNIIRYKWVSGVRLEAAGRLTRRYTAARSVFKFRYKGSLKNIDYSQKADISKRNASKVMLRNYVKSNSQYSFSKSKRRIGAFGLKAWVASY